MGTLDWSAIEASARGTLFERSLDPDTRSQLGAHCTEKDDILLVVEPALMASLRQEWAAVKTQAEAPARAAKPLRPARNNWCGRCGDPGGLGGKPDEMFASSECPRIFHGHIR